MNHQTLTSRIIDLGTKMMKELKNIKTIEDTLSMYIIFTFFQLFLF